MAKKAQGALPASTGTPVPTAAATPARQTT